MSLQETGGEQALRDIYVAGTFSKAGEWNDLLSRLTWYFTPYLDQIGSIQLCATPEQVAQATPLSTMDPAIAERLPALKSKITCLEAGDFRTRLTEADPAAAVFLLADEDEHGRYGEEIGRFRAKGRFFRVDPLRVRMEGSFYLWAGLNAFCDAEADTAVFHERFLQMAGELGQFDKAYVFGTGPSLSDFVASRDFSDGLTIIANSMVLNRELLDRLGPKIIVAGDPVFHAGCSGYAAAFRRELVQAMERTGAWFLCPLRDVNIYRTYLPDRLQPKIIGVPFDAAAPQSVGLQRNFALKPYPNILTLMLLPLAASFAREVHVAGCDGRPLAENDGFWQHDRKAQFNDEMENIKKTHPGFFEIDYNTYYFDHARDLEAVLSRLEESGCRVVTETTSYLPALNMREKPGLRPVAEAPDRLFRPDSLAILDPDALGEWGHFLAYDRRLGLAAVGKGLAFSVIGRRELAEWACPAHAQALLRVFSHHSWTLGNKWPRTDPAHLTAFAFEMEDALRVLEAASPEGDILLFMYCGSVEVAEVLEHVLIAHPRVRAVINLFWSYNFDITDAKYQTSWQPLLKRWTSRPGRVRVTHSTPQIAAQFRQVCGVEIPVLPHPSTTFGDRKAEQLAQVPARRLRPGHKPRILFPGGARLEKGYLLAAGACRRLADTQAYELCLRARLDGAPPEIREAVARLEDAAVTLDREDYSEAAFVDWLASADVIVIPYLPEAFADRTSGMLVDAMLLGIPVVVIEETWLADELVKSGAGCAAAATEEALVEAIEQVIADYPARAAATREAAAQYLHTSQWSTLLEVAVEVSGGSLPVRPDPAFRLACRPRPGQPFAEVSEPDAADIGEGLFLYDDPASVLATAVALRADWRQALEIWQAQAARALDLVNASGGRLRLVARDALAAASDAALARAGLARAELPPGWNVAPRGAGDEVLAILRALLAEDNRLRASIEAIETQRLPLPAPADPTVPAETVLERYFTQLDAGRAVGDLRTALAQTTARAEALEAEMASLGAQRRLLEEQLVQLQASAEQYFARAEALQEQAESGGHEVTALRAELERLYRSKSWRVTTPLRWLRRGVGGGSS